MLQKTLLTFALLSIISLSACSHVYGDKGVIKDRETDYLKAQSIPHLKIPPGLEAPAMQENYPVPDKSFPESEKKVSTTPPELYPNKQ